MTLDVIGLAGNQCIFRYFALLVDPYSRHSGFNYAFDALSGKPNALSKAFGEVTKRPPTFNVKQILRSIPPFNLLVSRCCIPRGIVPAYLTPLA